MERSAAAHTSLTCSVYDDCLLTFLDNYDSVFTVSQSETFTKNGKLQVFPDLPLFQAPVEVFVLIL